MKSRDYAADILAVVRQHAQIDASAARRIEAALRTEFVGENIRISDRPPVTPEKVDAELRQSKPVRVIATETGVHRSTIYRMLKARKSQDARKCDSGDR